MIDRLDITLFIITFIVGLCFMIVPFVVEEKRTFEYGMVLRAQIKGKKKERKGDTTKTYLIWRYTYNGKPYVYRSKRARTNEKREINDWGAVVVSKKDPSKVYEMMTHMQKTVLRIIGLFFMILPVICLCMMTASR